MIEVMKYIMTEEIIDHGIPPYEKDGKIWIDVRITNAALSQINKIILGDKVDQDNTKQVALRNQVHEDCLRLFKRFN